MIRDQPGSRARGGQPLRGVAMQLEAAMGGQLVGERLADELVAEAVARAGDDEDPGVQRDVEQGERLFLRQPGERQHAGEVEVVLGDGERGQRVEIGGVEGREALADRVTDRPRQRAARADARASSSAKNGLPCAAATIRATVSGAGGERRDELDKRRDGRRPAGRARASGFGRRARAR